ncbi:hypothetical protein BDZ85DRAFT_317700 [Elsinoe ampelina]|uniref:Uncharacterized protein n=1 Tax=Elsinoe ampelina TaxID=302913 RepID=A0A6A6GHZ5_9PEZI|nr:hypothetical protein BDZ85DRAFT_317700 [Elsinoe ampelina]
MQQPERQPDILRGTTATPSPNMADTMSGGKTTQIEPEVNDTLSTANSHSEETTPSASEPPDILPEMSAACAAVLGNPYLFEYIFSKLRMQDLLRCMRVATEWKKYIDGSIKLQQTLFFRPIETSIVVVPSNSYWFGSCSCGVRAMCPPETLEEGRDNARQGYVTHPLLVKQPRDKTEPASTQKTSWQLEPTAGFETQGGSRSFKHLMLAFSDRPSWTRMLVAQPPIHDIHVHWTTTRNGSTAVPYSRRIQTLDTSKGITWGDICTAILETPQRGWRDHSEAVDGIEMDRFFVPGCFAIYNRPHADEGKFCEVCHKQHRSLVMEV